MTKERLTSEVRYMEPRARPLVASLAKNFTNFTNYGAARAI